MIQLSRILLPTDLSECSGHALPYAVELASAFSAQLHIVYVIDTHWLGALAGAEFPGQIEAGLARTREAGEKALATLRAELCTVDVRTCILAGAPHLELVEYARRHEIDLIVMATHGRTRLAHALIGSVAEKTVQMAPCPVLTTKHPEHEFVMPQQRGEE
jgi:nucleotide-binding universal stress UspA family protein